MNKNYYEIILSTKQSWNDSMSINPEELLRPFSYMPEIVNEDILDYNPQKIIFSDSLFKGQTKKIDILYVPMCLVFTVCRSIRMENTDYIQN